MTKTLQIGITSELKNGNHVLLWDCDKRFDIDVFIETFNNLLIFYCHNDLNNYHLTVYESDRGYHIISLNEFDWQILLHLSVEMLVKGFICQNQLSYAIRQGSFTLRLTEKKIKGTLEKIITKDTVGKVSFEVFKDSIKKRISFEVFKDNIKKRKIVYHQHGTLPISKPHQVIFGYLLKPCNIVFNEWLYEYKKRFDRGFEIKGYIWDEK